LYLVRLKIRSPKIGRGLVDLITYPIEKDGDHRVLDKYLGRSLFDIPYPVLKESTDKGDGAVILNSDEVLIDHHRGLWAKLPPFLIPKEARSGTGHYSMASFSAYPFVHAVHVCSAEKRRIRTVEKRRPVPELSYDYSENSPADFYSIEAPESLSL
jgi:hypothetical protein